jgi:hypothetical protein
MRRAEDEPPDLPPPVGWEEESFEPPVRVPAEPAPKPQHVLIMERYAEESRLNGLKSHGQSQIPWNASASARSAVIETLAEYVTARRFPASMPPWEARQAIQARVAAVMEPFNTEAARQAEQKAKADARREEEEQDQRRADARIEHGKLRGMTKTFGWDFSDAQEARADVERALKDEVESDWTAGKWMILWTRFWTSGKRTTNSADDTRRKSG